MALRLKENVVVGGSYREISGRKLIYDPQSKKRLLVSSNLLDLLIQGVDESYPGVEALRGHPVLREFLVHESAQANQTAVRRRREAMQRRGRMATSVLFCTAFSISTNKLLKIRARAEMANRFDYQIMLLGLASLAVHEVGHVLAYWADTGITGVLKIDKRGARLVVPSDLLLTDDAARIIFFESGPILQGVFYAGVIRRLRRPSPSFIQILVNQFVLSVILGSALPSVAGSDGSKTYQVICGRHPKVSTRKRARWVVTILCSVKFVKDLKRNGVFAVF